MYIANSDITTYLNITPTAAETAILSQIVPAICLFADKYCNRTWTLESTTEITEYFDGGVNVFCVSKPPIGSIVSITDSDVPVTTANYYVYDSMVKFDYIPSRDFKNIKIVYKTSANAIPADLKFALIQWGAQMLKNQPNAGKDISSVTTGPVSLQYVTEKDIPPFAKMILDYYRLIDL